MAAEARWRVQDPVYGSTGVIDRLQQEIRAVQHELARTRAQLAAMAPPQGTQPIPPSRLLPPPPRQPLTAAAVEVVHAGAHGIAVQEEDEAPFMDPDEFLDLDGRL